LPEPKKMPAASVTDKKQGRYFENPQPKQADPVADPSKTTSAATKNESPGKVESTATSSKASSSRKAESPAISSQSKAKPEVKQKPVEKKVQPAVKKVEAGTRPRIVRIG